MNSYERVLAAINHERPDELPVNESPWEQTAEAWYQQGIPREISLADYFGYDIAMMYIDASPRFEMKVLERKDGNITYEDRYGYTCTKPEGIAATIHFVDHVNKDQKTWEQIKPRFKLDPNDLARIDDCQYFGHFDSYPTWEQAKIKYDQLRQSGRFILFMVYGPWEATWRHRGMEHLLMDVALEPDWVSDMANTFQNLVIDVINKGLEYGIKPDGILSADDLGSAHGPLMSPDMWRGIFQPCYKNLANTLGKNDITFFLHSDGAIGPLIDDFVDSGVKVLNPMEAKAGVDVVKLRERYGKNLAFYGNIDATKMYASQEAILKELQYKIPIARQGGYIMHSDHSCPPEVDLKRYQWILDTARNIFNEDIK